MSYNQGAAGGSGTHTGGHFPNHNNLRYSESRDHSHPHQHPQHQFFPPLPGTAGGMGRAGGHGYDTNTQQMNMQPNKHWFGGGVLGAFNSVPTPQQQTAGAGQSYSDGASWRNNDMTPFHHPSSQLQHQQQQQHIPNATNHQSQSWSWNNNNNNHAETTPFSSSQHGHQYHPPHPVGVGPNNPNANSNNFAWTNFSTASFSSRQTGDQADRRWTNDDATPFSPQQQPQPQQQQNQRKTDGESSSNICENVSKSLTELNQKWKARSERLGSKDDATHRKPSPKPNPTSIGLNPTEQRGATSFGTKKMDKKRIKSFEQRYPKMSGSDDSSTTATGVVKRAKMVGSHDQLPNWPWRDGNTMDSSSHSNVSNPTSAHIQSYSSRTLPPPPIPWGSQNQTYNNQSGDPSSSWQDHPDRPFGLPNNNSTFKYNPAPYEQPPLPPGPPPSSAKSHQVKAPPPPPPPLPPEKVSVLNVLGNTNDEGIQTRSMSRRQVPAQNLNEQNPNLKYAEVLAQKQKESKTRKKNKRKKEKRKKERMARMKKAQEEKLDQHEKDDEKKHAAIHEMDDGCSSVIPLSEDDDKVKSGGVVSDDMDISESEDEGSPSGSQFGNGDDNQTITSSRTKQMPREGNAGTEHRDKDLETSRSGDASITDDNRKGQKPNPPRDLNRRKQELLKALKKATLEKAKAQLAAAQLRKEGALKAKLLNKAKKKNEGTVNRISNSLHVPTPSHDRQVENMQESRKPLQDISAYSMKSLLISGIGTQGPDEKVRYRILESIPFTRSSSDNLDSSSQNTGILGPNSTNETNNSTNTRETEQIKADVQATIPEKLKLDLELAKRKLKLQELKKAKAMKDNEMRLNPSSTVLNDIGSKLKVEEKKSEFTEMKEKQPEKLKELRERLAKMKESIIVAKGANRELKYEQQVADLRRMIEKQRAMLAHHGDNVRSCTATLRTSEEKLKLETQGLEICQKRLIHVKQRKASTEKMVQSVTKKLMSLRKRREDDA